MGYANKTKPIDLLKTITGDEFTKKIKRLTSSSKESESVMKKISKGEGYEAINKEAHSLRNESKIEKARSINSDSSLSEAEKRTQLQNMINEEKEQQRQLDNQRHITKTDREERLSKTKDLPPQKRFDDTVTNDNYSADSAVKKAYSLNDSWGSSLRRENQYKKLGVGDKS